MSEVRQPAGPIDFYFDFSSPYGYFAAEQIDALAARYGRSVLWHPFLLGVTFKVTGLAPLIVQQLATFGFDAAPGTTQALGAFIAEESARFKELVQRTGATATLGKLFEESQPKAMEDARRYGHLIGEELAEFGGVAQHVSHWSLGVLDGGPGHCFPSGHASSAFAFFALLLTTCVTIDAWTELAPGDSGLVTLCPRRRKRPHSLTTSHTMTSVS